MQLLQHFHELSLHPKNAKELKGMILQLAVQGKLTAQWRVDHPELIGGDHSAQVLLMRMIAEKAQLVKEGKIKKGKSSPSISKDDVPYILPSEWIWCTLNEVCQYIQRGKSPKYAELSSIPIVSQKCVQWSGFDISKARYITEESIDKYGNERFLQVGDLLWNSTGDGTVGRVILFPETEFQKVVADSHVTVVRAFKNYLIPEYLQLFAASPFIQNSISGRVSGSTKQTELATGTLKAMEFSLPPLEEQKAIVEVVEQLFKEVEQLGQLTEKRIRLKEQFATSALRDLTTKNTVKEWEVLQPHFHTFFNEAPNIKKLRESILQLAVQGKLTAHWRTLHSPFEGGTGDAKDHDATLLLDRIKVEKAQLIKEKKIKKEKPLPPITESEIPNELPEGWGYEYIRNVSSVVTCGIASTPQYTDTGKIFLSAKNVKPFTFKPKEHKFVSQELYEKITKNAKPEKGDILLTRVGAGIGEACVIDQDIDFAFYVSLTLVKPLHRFIDSYYMLYWLSSKDGIGKVLDNIYGKGVSQGNLNVNQVRQFVLPIPPLKEQKAIVETVNRLMALCDRLEQQVKLSKEQVERWMKGVVREVLGAVDQY